MLFARSGDNRIVSYTDSPARYTPNGPLTVRFWELGRDHLV